MHHQQLSPPKTYNLTATSITYSTILTDISLTAHPAKILAVVGPSGSGKSTLLNILSALIPPTSGTLLLNSTPLLPSTYRSICAHLSQNDFFLPFLTVAETFSFAAKLLKPNPSEQFTVTSLLNDLQLSHVAESRISGGVSGGELRRVSIGLCLLRHPKILILDEPTTSLDSSSAFNVMRILKSIAVSSSQRTVIVSIHQPNFKILSTVDDILLMSEGRVVHHGTLGSLNDFLQINGFIIPPQLNSVEFSMEILPRLKINNSSSNASLQSSASDSDQNYYISPVTLECGKVNKRKNYGRNLFEIVILSGRLWKFIYRTRQLLLTNTLEALITGVILGTVYINISDDKSGIQKRLGLFAFTLTFLLSTTTETLPIFITERPILVRETSDKIYHLSSYLFANTIIYIPYLLFIAIVYSVSVYFLAGLCFTSQTFCYFVLVIWAILLIANSLILFVSSVAPNYIAGTSLVTALLGVFFLFSGYFISKQRIPKYWMFMHFVSFYKYALDALLINEYSCVGSRCLNWDKGVCDVKGKDVLQNRGLDEGQRWSNVGFLIVFFVLYRVIWLLALIRRLR